MPHVFAHYDRSLARVCASYAIEDDTCGKPADLRPGIRQSRAKLLLDELRTWMEKTLRRLSSKSESAGVPVDASRSYDPDG